YELFNTPDSDTPSSPPHQSTPPYHPSTATNMHSARAGTSYASPSYLFHCHPVPRHSMDYPKLATIFPPMAMPSGSNNTCAHTKCRHCADLPRHILPTKTHALFHYK